ncbi:MAG TPA: 16S rRNA (guanine(527)-N(7))-methyltransferase RsmG [Candidatus Atribacteria bacterium]|nr:16S rRNA (guanine(527)-N(7))-methyltransferase RsmG [Candidatus Atribacteria bacterium]HPT78698.1 16S rRNA (guanine(527)-N(7))-methyltransferase RsmG [Candidatus Atribacteria bacterium]
MSKEMGLLLAGSADMGITLDTESTEKFQKYLEMLTDWNTRINLTAITDPEEIVVQHFLDSLSLLTTGLIKKDAAVLDMGTGAGFPGMPLKIAVPEIGLTLVDSVSKKVNFLNELITALGLEKARALHGRAEDLGRQKSMRESYDIVVSRAVAELRVLLEYTLPFVRTGGWCIFNKGPGALDEIKAAGRAATVLGGGELSCIAVSVPMSEKTHNLVMIRKERPTPEKYPRPAGKPKKDPL